MIDVQQDPLESGLLRLAVVEKRTQTTVIELIVGFEPHIQLCDQCGLIFSKTDKTSLEWTERDACQSAIFPSLSAPEFSLTP